MRLGFNTASLPFVHKHKKAQCTSFSMKLACQRCHLRTVSETTDNDSSADSNDNSSGKIPHVLVVAGSDSGAGAGIQADLKACAARGAYCSTVITAVTAQNSMGVQGVSLVPDDFVAKQLDSVLSDMQVDVVKTGMLPSAGMVDALRHVLDRFPVKALVVDPVMVSTSGDTLTGPSVLSKFREDLLPMAAIVTPNVREASELLGGMPIHSISHMRSAAKLLHSLGPRNVLVKGGDLSDAEDAVDILFDGELFHELRLPRIKTRNTHGTGCSLASCIAAEIAKGSSIPSAVKTAKHYIEAVLQYSKDINIGKGPQGPFDHFMRIKNCSSKSGRQTSFRPDDLLLYAVTDSNMNKKWNRSVVDAVEAAIEGGATIIQLREKEAETRELVETAEMCLRVCRRKGVPFLINDRVDVALACDADGVHVGQSDMAVRVARNLLGPDKIIGVSCKTEEQALRAFEDGADYIGCGGVFPTSTKANNVTIGLDGLRAVCRASKLPVVAIGGINASNAGEVLRMGASRLRGVAVVSALFNAEDVRGETEKMHELLVYAMAPSKV